MKNKVIGFIGLGSMGQRMAKNILKGGYDLNIYNRTKSRADKLISSGANWCSSPRELAQKSDIIISMVRDNEAAEIIWLDTKEGASLGLEPGKIAIEMSTLEPELSVKLSRELEKKKCDFIESPVVGTLPQAEAGALVLLLAGEVSESAMQVLGLLSSKQIRLSNIGDSARLKLAINSLFAIQVAAFSEWVSVLKKSHFSEEMIYNLFPNLPITSPIMQVILDQMKEEKFESQFPISLVAKDLGYASRLVESNSSGSSLTAATWENFTFAESKDLGNLNISALIKAR